MIDVDGGDRGSGRTCLDLVRKTRDLVCSAEWCLYKGAIINTFVDPRMTKLMLRYKGPSPGLLYLF